MPALETAIGGITIAEHLLAQTLSACTQFQVDCGATGDATTTLTHCYFDALPKPDDRASFTAQEFIALRPFAIISTNPYDGGYGWSRIAAESWDDEGALILTFEYNTPDELADDNSKLMRWLKNRMGNIMRPDPDVSGQSAYVGLTDLAQQPGYLAVTSCRLMRDQDVPAYGRGNEKSVKTFGDFVAATFDVRWGVRQ